MIAGALQVRHQQRHSLRRRGQQRRERGAGPIEFARLDGGTRHRQTALTMIRHLLREKLDARQPFARRIAEPDVRISIGQVGMRIGIPRHLDRAHGTANLIVLAVEFRGQHGCRHQLRRELDRLHRALACEIAVALLQF